MSTKKNKKISVAELDFDAIKDNLKEFMRGQSQFQDYDFEGSSLSILIDLLAYNTHYNAIYSNLAVNESFLDSASKRASVVSLAKTLGYIPNSAVCSRAIVSATVASPQTSPDIVTIPAFQPFNTVIDGNSFTFYNPSSVQTTRNGSGNYVFENLELVEGQRLTFRFTYSDTGRYVIPNPNVDLSTLNVTVQETASSDFFENYVAAENLIDVESSSKIYFIREIDDGLYELKFGDGILGNKLDDGNVITLRYFVSSLSAPNGARNFSYGGSPIVGSSLSVSTNTPGFGGQAAENIESIKFNAPRLYAAQNRAVTPEDYKAIIYKFFPESESVNVWGGENNDPPIYGKTFISVKPREANTLTNLQKEFIINNILNKRNIVSITPEIIDPEYFNIKLTTTVYYNPRETSKTPSQIETIVKNAVLAYDDQELQRFDGILRFSRLSRIIDESDPAIVNNISRIMVRREFTPRFGINAEYKLNLINPISQDGGKQGDVFGTTGFFIPNSTRVHYLDDDAVGNLRLYYRNANLDKVIVNPSIGTIEYEAGRVVVRNLNIVALEGPIFEMQVKPESYDVVSALNQIVQISRPLLLVTAVADDTINGDLQAGYNYKFTSIRS